MEQENKKKKKQERYSLLRIYSFLRARYAPRGAQISFSGSGEDLIMKDFLFKMGIKKVSYVDIGAHHPFFGNNTYLFYRQGGRGVLIEPNEELCEIIKKKRKNDLCLNVGVGKENTQKTFFKFSRNTRNTFSIEEADAWEKQSGDKAQTENRDIYSLDYIIDTYCKEPPHIISIDTEGYDIEILSGFSWQKRPLLFCIELVASSGEKHDRLDAQNGVVSIMNTHNYRLLARTPINAIFVDAQVNT